MRSSDWSSDVCSSDLIGLRERGDRGLDEHLARYQLALLGRKVDVHDGGLRRLDVLQRGGELLAAELEARDQAAERGARLGDDVDGAVDQRHGGLRRRHGRHVGADRRRSEEHTSELPSLMRISYAVFCLKKKQTTSQLKRNIHI